MDLSRQGERVEFVASSDPYTKLKEGDQGTYFGMDDMRQHMINWDNGSRLSMISGEDFFNFL